MYKFLFLFIQVNMLHAFSIDIKAIEEILENRTEMIENAQTDLELLKAVQSSAQALNAINKIYLD